MSSYKEVLEFWFEELKPEQWWNKDEKLDADIKERFQEAHAKAIQGELWDWRTSARGRLAEVLVIDQFSRSIYRNRPESFAWDSMALVLAQEAIQHKLNEELSSAKRAFLYMPYMHSESKAIHQLALELYSEEGLEFNLDFEIKHKKIIDRFGRYPHRNQVLGRESSAEEIEFLKGPDSSF